MLLNSRALRVYAYPAPADMRKGYDGLYRLALDGLGRDPLSGDVYLFCNRAQTRSKRETRPALYYDGTGLCILMKRLESGRFAKLWREGHDTPGIELTVSELALFLEGSNLVGKVRLSPCETSKISIAQRGIRK